MTELLVEKNITQESVLALPLARIKCKDWATLMDYLKEHGYLSHPMIIGGKDGIWSADIYPKAGEQE